MQRAAAAILAVLSSSACAAPREPDPPQPAGRVAIGLDERGISIGKDIVVGPGDVPAAAPARVEALHTKLKERREAWKLAHFREPFEGAIDASIAPPTACVAGMSLLSTAASAGYPRAKVSLDTLQLDVEMEPPASEAMARVYLSFHGSGTVEVRGHACLAAYDTVAVSELVATLKEWPGFSDIFTMTLFASCEPGAPFRDVLAAFGEVRKVQPKATLAVGFACPGAAGVRPSGADPSAGTGAMPGATPDAGPGGGAAKRSPGAKRTKARVREGAVTVQGPLTEDAVRGVVHEKLGAMEACYRDGLRDNAALQGSFTTRFVIGRKGGVVSIHLSAADMPDTPVVRCVMTELGDLQFPPAKSAVTVIYPLLFSLE